MPDWMTEYLKQSPTLAICLGVAFFAWKSNQSIHTRYPEELEKSHTNHLQSKDIEIARLAQELEVMRKERDKLLKQITTPKEKPRASTGSFRQ